jgi:hypothetical protein
VTNWLSSCAASRNLDCARNLTGDAILRRPGMKIENDPSANDHSSN